MTGLQRSGLGRRFSEAARAAAVVARQRKQAEEPPVGTPALFVVRSVQIPRRYVWEVRRFGGVVLRRSGLTYPTPEAARAAGRICFATMNLNG